MHSANLGVAQLGARYLGVVEAAGSSPVTQIKIRYLRMSDLFVLYRIPVYGLDRRLPLELFTILWYNMYTGFA